MCSCNDIKPRRVALTGMGVCSSLGFSDQEIIGNLKEKNVFFTRPSFDNDVVISPIRDFEIKSFIDGFKDRRYLTRGGQLCLAAASRAIRDSGLKKDQLSESGLFMGVGPNLDIGTEIPKITNGKMNQGDLLALWMLRFLPNTAASVVAKYAGIHGENLTITTACAASLQAIGEAFRRIKEGRLDLAMAGGGDSRLSPGGIMAYKSANALFTGGGLPENASRPFDSHRAGFVPGEGGAIFLLEEWSHAEKRGAKIYGEICGYGSAMDGYNMTAPSPDGKWAEQALRVALKDAEMGPEEIDVVSAHATGTPLNDEMETSLLARVFSSRPPFVIALKSWFGHMAAACGALELAVGLVCMKEGYLPEIRNLDDPCGPEINWVREARPYSFDTMLLENFGFGGQNGVLVVRKS